MAFNITPFKSTDDFTMAGFNSKIQEINNGIGAYANEYWWRRRSINSGWYQVDTTETNRLLKDDIHDTVVYTYGDSISISQTDGTITINSTTSMTLTRSTVTVDKLAVLKGKYFKTDVNQEVGSSNIHIVAGDIYFVPADASITKSYDSDSGATYYSTSELTHVTTEYRDTIGDWEYLQSSNRNAYPDSGTQDGYEYEYLGIPFDNAVNGAKIETGSYVGTGTYGASNPSQITFSFAPSWIIMLYVDGRYPHRLHLTDYGATSFLPMDALTTNYENTQSPSVQGYSADTTYAKKSADGKTFYWYNTNSAGSQLNNVNDKIYYIAIG